MSTRGPRAGGSVLTGALLATTLVLVVQGALCLAGWLLENEACMMLGWWFAGWVQAAYLVPLAIASCWWKPPGMWKGILIVSAFLALITSACFFLLMQSLGSV